MIPAGFAERIVFAPSAPFRGQWFWGSILGRLILLGYTWALVHHALGGLRHFVWDTGAGLGPERLMLSRLTLIGSLAITLGLWILGYWVR